MNKYRNKRYAGYASKKEANRAIELHALARAGIISGLEEQVRFELIPKDELGRAIAYVADFVYHDQGKLVVEDVKSPATRTPVYLLKRRLMWQRHQIRITEVY